MSHLVVSWLVDFFFFFFIKNETENRSERNLGMLLSPFISLASTVSEFPARLMVNPKTLWESSVNLDSPFAGGISSFSLGNLAAPLCGNKCLLN